MQLHSILAGIGRELARVALPAWCIVCDEDLPWSERVKSVCLSCWQGLPRIAGTKCRGCALPLAAPFGSLCIACQQDVSPAGWCDAWGRYSGGLEKVLQAFKFGRHDFLATPLAELLAEVVRSHPETIDVVTAVPMPARSLRKRGYNQAGLLANDLARIVGAPYVPDLLIRLREAVRQSTLPRAARSANVRGVFGAHGVSGRSVLIVDDICTTGSTLHACARALQKNGASFVGAVAVAKVT